MKIVALRCHVARMAPSWLTESVIANPMSIYPEYQARRSSWFRSMSAAVVEIELEDATRGYGFVGGGKGAAAAVAIDEQLRHLVVGRTVFEAESIQEQLYRASIFYGRGGFTQAMLSGIDIALWDAQGKLLGRPVSHLLGGAARPWLRVYYTGNDPSALAEFGIKDMKIAVPYGPAHGEAGMRANEDVIAHARDTLGPKGFLALDIYMAWDVPYTLRMYERLEKFNIAWLEEPVLPDDYRGYAEIRRRVNTMVSGGEHEYTLEGFRRLIGEGCVDSGAARHLPRWWAHGSAQDRRARQGGGPRADLPWHWQRHVSFFEFAGIGDDAVRRVSRYLSGRSQNVGAD